MKRIFTLSLVCFCFMQMMANFSLVVKPLQGQDCITALSKVGKIVYSGDSLKVYDDEKALVFADLFANVQHVRITEEMFNPTEVDKIEDEPMAQVMVYPNPTQDLLNIKNVTAKTVRLYSASGQLLQAK